MFDNKILVNLFVLSLGKNFEVYIPVNEKVGNITKLLNTTLFDSMNNESNYVISNIDNGKVYTNNELIRNTDIENGTKLILI